MTAKPPAPSRRDFIRRLFSGVAAVGVMGAIKVCPSCGAPNPGSAVMCGNCLRRLKLGADEPAAPSRSPSYAERKDS